MNAKKKDGDFGLRPFSFAKKAFAKPGTEPAGKGFCFRCSYFSLHMISSKQGRYWSPLTLSCTW